MGRVLLCVGSYAKNPYYIEAFCLNVFCLEELCYCLREHTYLTDRSIMEPDLTDWIRDECGCKDLADELADFIKRKSSLGVFVSTILEYTGYLSREEIQTVEALLKNNSNLTEEERAKSHADYLLENKKYEKAVTEYKTLSGLLRESNPELCGKVLHNLGVAYTRLFLFEQAAKLFDEAYQLSGAGVSRLHYLAAMRMYLAEQDYILLFADSKPDYPFFMELEKEIEQITKEWENSDRKKYLEKVKEKKRTGSSGEYYEAVDSIVNELKEEYRKGL